MRNATRSILLLAAAVLLSTGSAASAADSVCGDVNQSGTLTSSDALLALRKGVGQSVTLSCAPLAAPLKTGQVTCHNDNGDLVSCASSGADGELQRGVAREFTDNGDGTVTDTKTGLMWEKLSRDNSVHDQDKTWSWGDATGGKIAALNSANFAGHNDWRLPNLFELRTLLNLGAHNPATWPAFHSSCAAACTVTTCSCTPPEKTWTSSEYAGSGNLSWSIEFLFGVESQLAKTDTMRVRAVRGGY